MVAIENRSVVKKGDVNQAVMTLPSGHKITESENVNLIIGERIIILASTEIKLGEIKSEVETLLKEI